MPPVTRSTGVTSDSPVKTTEVEVLPPSISAAIPLSMTKIHRLFCGISFVLYVLYYWICMVDPLFDLFAPRIAFTVVPWDPVMVYFRRNIAVFCFLMTFEFYDKWFETNTVSLRNFYFRQFCAWIAFLVINSIAVAQSTLQVALGSLHIALCAIQIVFSFLSFMRARRVIRFTIQ